MQNVSAEHPAPNARGGPSRQRVLQQLHEVRQKLVPFYITSLLCFMTEQELKPGSAELSLKFIAVRKHADSSVFVHMQSDSECSMNGVKM